MLAEFGAQLDKNEIVIGLGNGRSLHILPNGRTESLGLSELPAEAYFMLPLVAKIVPQEFEGPGDFIGIKDLEDTLGAVFGSVDEVYKATGPYLARKGVTVERVAKALMEVSPIHTMKKTGYISRDAYNQYQKRLETEITRYYPGSLASERKINNPVFQAPTRTGTHKSPDGVDF